jgi:hypothetical protein
MMSSGPSRRVVAGRAPRGRLDFGRLRFTRGVDVPRAASKSQDGSNHSEARRRLVTRCSLDQAGRVTRGRAGRIGGVVRAVHACIHLSPGADLADSAATRRGRSHGTEYHPDVKSTVRRRAIIPIDECRGVAAGGADTVAIVTLPVPSADRSGGSRRTVWLSAPVAWSTRLARTEAGASQVSTGAMPSCQRTQASHRPERHRHVNQHRKAPGGGGPGRSARKCLGALDAGCR